MEKLYYFGTNLTEAGHYFWELSDVFEKMNTRPQDFEWNCYHYKNERVGFVQAGCPKLGTDSRFAIVSITGSPYDKREGTVSVFFARTDTETLFRMINKNELAVSILKKIPYLTRCFDFNFPHEHLGITSS